VRIDVKIYHWTRNCPNCGQGRVLILENLNERKLYLHCEECEWGWRDPERATDAKDGFLTLNESFQTRVPTSEEIRERGWAPYVSGTFEE
jgi:hypothetical protein